MTEDAASLRFIGHSTVLIALDGVRVLTDPVLRGRVAHLRRAGRVDLDPAHGPDAVLISHGHRDHLDLPSLVRLGRTVPLVVPRGLGRLLRWRGFTRVREVEVGERFALNGVEILVTAAQHEARREPLGVRTETVGYAVLGSHRVLFLGDTGLFDGMEGLVDDLDVALLPVWGWGPTLGRGEHLDPVTAAEAARRLRPRVAVPIHWGTFRPMHRGVRTLPPFLSDPPEAFARALRSAAPGIETRVLLPGEELPL